jgi:hypothetical protein
VNSPVNAAGDLRAISAFRTFKQIAAAHGRIFLFVAPFRKPWEGGDVFCPELSALAPKRKSGCLWLRAGLSGHGCTAEDSHSDLPWEIGYRRSRRGKDRDACVNGKR